MMRKRVAGIGVLMALCPALAFAHGLNLFVLDEGGVAKGSVYFTGGAPAKNVPIQVLDSAGSVLAETTTDAEGNFTHAGATAGATLTFVASTPDGHRAEAKLIRSERAGSQTPSTASTRSTDDPSSTPPSSNSGAEPIAELRIALDQLEHKLWLRDVIGGIGYTFGLAGLWALWKSRQGRGGR